MNYGTKIDVLIEHMTTKEQVWLYCILGDVKAHTFSGLVDGKEIDGQGVFQTGFTKSGEWASGNMDASIVEFMGINNMRYLYGLGAYRLIKIMIYDQP